MAATPAPMLLFKAPCAMAGFRSREEKGEDGKCSFYVDSLLRPDGKLMDKEIVTHNTAHSGSSSKSAARSNGACWYAPFPGHIIDIETQFTETSIMFRCVSMDRLYRQMVSTDKPRLFAVTAEQIHGIDGRILPSRDDYHALLKDVRISKYDTRGCAVPVYVDFFTAAKIQVEEDMDGDPEDGEGKGEIITPGIRVSKPNGNKKKGLEVILSEVGFTGPVAKPGKNFLSSPVIVGRAPAHNLLMADSSVSHPIEPITLHTVPCATLNNPWFPRLIGFNGAAFKRAIKAASKAEAASQNNDQVMILKEPDAESNGFKSSDPVSILAWMIYTFHEWWRVTTAHWFDVNRSAAALVTSDGAVNHYPLTESKDGTRYMLVVTEVLTVLVNELERLIPKPDILSNLTHFGLAVSFGPKEVTEQDEDLAKTSDLAWFRSTPMHIDIEVTLRYLPLTSDFPTVQPPVVDYKGRTAAAPLTEEVKTDIHPPAAVSAGPKKKVTKDKYTVIPASAPAVPTRSTGRTVTMGKATPLAYVDPADM
jgi:hypothetical protein